ncbi:hypothetical protein [Pararhizobium sp. IMCC21322]|nr:hypothetical protein [Pararhizobium sp. IMCC21322]
MLNKKSVAIAGDMAIDLLEEIIMFIDEPENGWINKLYARCQ